MALVIFVVMITEPLAFAKQGRPGEGDSGLSQGVCESRNSESDPDCSYDNATTVHEIGIAAIAEAVGGRQPVRWKEHRIAHILASIDASGYGEINRLRLYFNVLESDGSDHVDVIVKRFLPQPLHGVDVGSLRAVEHSRHMQAFVVEANFYHNLASILMENNVTLPRVLHSTPARAGQNFTMLLDDLSLYFPRGSNGQTRQFARDEVFASLRWLAGLHGLFWEHPRAEERGLWSRGCYWHLDELGLIELESVNESYSNRYLNNHEWQRLRAAAKALDRRLAGYEATPSRDPIEPSPSKRFKTLLHGDAKPENILCSVAQGNNVRCAGLDFAWAGEGYGMYDVMYLLWGEYTQESVDEMLHFYHAELMASIPGNDYTIKIMKQHFEIATLDFLRWWVGFKNGTYFWAMPWAMATMRRVLWRLDGGRLRTPEEYAEAVDHEFPL